jgi:hypothetical protein
MQDSFVAILLNAHHARNLQTFCSRQRKEPKLFALVADRVLSVWPETDPEVAAKRLPADSPLSFECREVRFSKYEVEVILAALKAESIHPNATGGSYLQGLRLATLFGGREEYLLARAPEQNTPQNAV